MRPKEKTFRNRNRQILGIILILLFLLISRENVLGQDGPFDKDEVEHFSQSVVLLLVETSNGEAVQGSGVIVSPDGIVFTAAHVVENAFDINIAVFDGEDRPPRPAYSGRIRYLSKTLDFAIVEIFADQQGQPVNTTTLNLPYIAAWSTDNMMRTEPVYIWGYPQIAGGVLSSTTGSISAPFRQGDNNSVLLYETDAVFATGGSGGLVINSEGEFIGIPIYFRVDGASKGQLTTFIPASTICEIEPEACDFRPLPTPIPISTSLPVSAGDCPSEAISPPLSSSGETLYSVGTGVLANVIHPFGYTPTGIKTVRELHQQYPCIQYILESTPVRQGTSERCVLSRYRTNRIWFGIPVAGTTIIVKNASEGEYIEIGRLDIPSSDSMSYIFNTFAKLSGETVKLTNANTAKRGKPSPDARN